MHLEQLLLRGLPWPSRCVMTGAGTECRRAVRQKVGSRGQVRLLVLGVVPGRPAGYLEGPGEEWWRAHL